MATQLSEQLQSADWKVEKHAPVIEAPSDVKAGETFEVKLTVGKEIPHPNTTEHHIRYISLYFKPDGEKFTYQVGHFEFTAHGESVPGPNQGPVYTAFEVSAHMSIQKPGTLLAESYCNIHGLWQSSQSIGIQA
jgi:superoxide reductase